MSISPATVKRHWTVARAWLARELATVAERGYAVGRDEYLILSTAGGVRADDGTPIALGYHTGHWEVGLLMEAAARELKAGELFAPASLDWNAQ